MHYLKKRERERERFVYITSNFLQCWIKVQDHMQNFFFRLKCEKEFYIMNLITDI